MNDSMELDTAVLFDKTGRGNGGFDALKCVDHASTVGELTHDLKGLLIDRLFSRPVDCPYVITIDHSVSPKQQEDHHRFRQPGLFEKPG